MPDTTDTTQAVQPKFVPTPGKKVTVPEVLYAFVDYYKKFDGWDHHFHVTLGSHNRGKSSWDYEIDNAMTSGDPIAVELARVMSYLTVTQREKAAWQAYYLARGETPPSKRKRPMLWVDASGAIGTREGLLNRMRTDNV